MASTSRFYNPSRGNYQSMFVPNVLPTELMVGALGARQKKEDLQRAAAVELGNYQEKALPGYDTEYVKGIQGELQNFAGNYINAEMSSPEMLRQYQQFQRKIKTDPGLQSVRGAVATHDQYIDRIKELEKQGATEAADVLRYDYKRRYGEYTKSGGQGYTGDISLGDPLIREGVDVQAEAEKYFDDMKANGYEGAKSISDALGTSYYKVGSEGVSQARLDDRTRSMIDGILQAPVGQQLQKEYAVRKGIADYEVDKMSESEKKNFQKESEKYVLERMRDISGEFAYNKTTTDLAGAQNRMEQRKFENPEAVIMEGTLGVMDSPQGNMNWDAQINNENASLKQYYNSKAEYERMLKLDPNNVALQQEYNGILRDIKEADNRKALLNNEKSQAWNQMMANNPEAQRYQKLVLAKEQELHDKTGYLTREQVANLEKAKGTKRYSELVEQYSKGVKNTSSQEALRLEQELQVLKSGLQNTIAKDWNQYYTGNTNTQKQAGIVSVPMLPGSVGKQEETFINNNPTAYNYYDEKGNPIKLTDNQGLKASDFKLGSITQEDFQGTNTNGRVGTMKKIVQKKDKDGELVYRSDGTPETETRLIQVIAVPKSGNATAFTKEQYANTYLKSAEMNVRAGDVETAKLAKREALKLLNPELVKQLYNTQSEDFKSGVVTYNVNNTTDPRIARMADANGRVTLVIEKTPQGRIQVESTNRSAWESPIIFNDVDDAVEGFTTPIQ